MKNNTNGKVAAKMRSPAYPWIVHIHPQTKPDLQGAVYVGGVAGVIVNSEDTEGQAWRGKVTQPRKAPDFRGKYTCGNRMAQGRSACLGL